MTVYDASSNTAYVFDLPQKTGSSSGATAHGVPTLDEITTFLADLGKHWTVSGAEPSNVAGQEAYTVTVSPTHDGGLLGSAELAWDAVHGTPLKVAVYAQGSSSPVLALEASQISFGSVPDFRHRGLAACRRKDRRPVVADLGRLAPARRRRSRASPRFRPLRRSRSSRPTRSSVCRARMSGSSARPTPGRCSWSTARGSARSWSSSASRTPAKSGQAGMLDALPSVSLDGVTAHELATQLGTVLSWDRGGVSYILAGSLPTSAAESAARSLK